MRRVRELQRILACLQQRSERRCCTTTFLRRVANRSTYMSVGSNWTELRKANTELNQSEYETGLVRLSSRPRMAFVELTRGCNLSCPMCRPKILAGAKFHMSTDLLDQLQRELFPY